MLRNLSYGKKEKKHQIKSERNLIYLLSDILVNQNYKNQREELIVLHTGRVTSRDRTSKQEPIPIKIVLSRRASLDNFNHRSILHDPI